MTVPSQAAANAPFAAEPLDRMVSALGTDDARELRADILRLLSQGVPADGRGKGFWAKMKEALGA